MIYTGGNRLRFRRPTKMTFPENMKREFYTMAGV
jgi:hypothetical protein